MMNLSSISNHVDQNSHSKKSILKFLHLKFRNVFKFRDEFKFSENLSEFKGM